jgi:hypothetical protein
MVRLLADAAVFSLRKSKSASSIRINKLMMDKLRGECNNEWRSSDITDAINCPINLQNKQRICTVCFVKKEND